MASFANQHPGYPATPDEDPKLTLRYPTGNHLLAVLQTMLGTLLIFLELLGMGVGLLAVDPMAISGTGIWNGLIYVTTGMIGVLATQPSPRQKRYLMAFLVLSIISSVAAAGMCVFGLMVFTVRQYDGSTSSDDSNTKFYAVRVTSIVLYLCELICFIVTAAFGCCNVCHCGGADSANEVFRVEDNIAHQMQVHPGQYVSQADLAYRHQNGAPPAPYGRMQPAFFGPPPPPAYTPSSGLVLHVLNNNTGTAGTDLNA